MNKSKNLLFTFILIGILFAILEASSYVIIKKFFIPRGLTYSPPPVSKDDYNKYLKKRHPSLGWIVAKNQEDEIDAVGSRIIPAFPDPIQTNSCVSLYGDSYTFSNRTTPKEAWSNQLSILLDCRVSNFGVSGYGTDQALMRYLENVNDSAPIVFLNHFVDDIPRNVSQHWGTRFSTKRQAFLFKPRFILTKEDSLEKIELPQLSFNELLKLQDAPNSFLEYDYFIPNGHYGSQFFNFPYTWTLVKTMIIHSKFKSIFSGEPAHTPFYKEDHPSNSLKLTLEIMKKFADVAERRDQLPIITIIPFSNDFDYFRKNDEWAYQNLIDSLGKNKLSFINLGEEIEKELNGEDQSYLYAGEGHFNKNGDKLISKIIYEKLKNYKK